ncbi:MAG: DEAD/DEAH box helicase family protein [Candidatus Sericytochromatia bacterium]|nr:DEAD/DEAH box helicase family protein [Candidatus Sericytochromatia bacterium]
MDALFGTFELAVDFHPYQQEALSTLLNARAEGQRRLHLVAPPGSGKTLLGLEMARRLGQPAVILSPNTVIQQQWVQSFEAKAVDLDGLRQSQEQQVIDTDPTRRPPLLSLTYQKVSVKGTEGLHDNVEDLFEQLAEAGYRTLILDECHHLLAHWAHAVQHFSERLEDSVLLGLTATLPLGRAPRDLAVYLKLIGPVDYEILAPAVIREGHLAPFQDLVYLVRPTELESRFVARSHRALHQLLRQLEAPSEDTRQPALPSLSFWAENWLLEPHDAKGQVIPASELLSRMPDRAIACLRYLNQQGLDLQHLPWCPELEDPPALEDLAELLGAYGNEVLADQAPEQWQQLREALAELGYRFQQGRFRLRQGAIDQVLAFSAAKLRAVGEILQLEQAHLGEQLCALILTDFESTHAAGQRAATAGVLDPEAGGALAVMRYLCADNALRELSAVLVTGQTLLCSAVCAPDFVAAAQAWLAERDLVVSLQQTPIDDFVQISGQGSAWRSALYLALVTDLLEQGAINCLIGTRALLGEGWNCKALNTLIDLTAVTSYVAVNQIRGRTLRHDARYPLKVANNWDVVALLPELEGGLRDLQRLGQKHAHFYGLCDDGRIEKGVGHVDTAFEKLSERDLLQQWEAINHKMCQQAAGRLAAYTAWGVGKPYHNRQLSGLQLKISPELLALSAAPQANTGGPRRLPALRLQQLPRVQQARQVALTLQVQRQRQGFVAVQLLGWGGLLALLGSQPLLALLWLGLWQGGWWQWKQRPQPDPVDETDTLAPPLLVALAQGLCQALQALEDEPFWRDGAQALQPGWSQRRDGSLRVALSGADSLLSEAFARDLGEMLEPLAEQRYLLGIPQLTLQHTRQRFFADKLTFTEPEWVYLPLPRRFARSRGRAEALASALRETLGPLELLYTRQPGGQAALESYRRQRALPARLQPVEIWE